VKSNQFSGFTPCKSSRKFVQTSHAQKLQFIGHIFVADIIKALVHSVTHGQLRKQ